MKFKYNKEIEYFIKKIFFSEKYLLKRRLERAFKKKYENELLILNKLVNKNLDSVDIGVFRGVYSYQLSKHSTHVHSFEPNPLIYTYLNKNLTKIISNMTLYNYAISDTSGNAELRIPRRNNTFIKDNYDEQYRLGLATIHKKNIFKSDIDSFIVKTIKLDQILTNKKIGFIKIDVEGHEKNVINSANEIIKKYRPNLLVEIEKRHNNENVEDTINFINNLGYKSFFLDNNNLISTKELKNFDLKNNFIFKN